MVLGAKDRMMEGEERQSERMGKMNVKMCLTCALFLCYESVSLKHSEYGSKTGQGMFSMESCFNLCWK